MTRDVAGRFAASRERRRIAVVGAGQAGSQLAIGLQRTGFDVSLFTDRDPAAVRNGDVSSAQCMFETAIDAENAVDLALWADECPPIRHVALQLREPGMNGAAAVTSWEAPLDVPARSIDQRLKISCWLERFTGLKGDLRIVTATLPDLERLAAEYDLTVVATGQSELNGIFPVDRAHSDEHPRRRYALTYLAGLDEVGDRLHLQLMPEVGELSVLPALTTTGRCMIVLFAAVLGGPLDHWADVRTADDHLARTFELLDEFWPEQAQRLGGGTLTDEGGRFVGSLTATTRSAVGHLPSGRPVLGMADAILLTDPTTPGQGANTAAKAAAFYLERIVERGDRPFDAAWMARVGDDFWRSWSRWVELWARSMVSPLPVHGRDLLIAARTSPSLAADIVNALDDPARFHPWWYDAAHAHRFLERHQSGTGAIDSHALRRTLSSFATGVTVVTTRTADGHVVGVTANSFTSVSLDPPLVLWCLAKGAASLRYFQATSRFAINVLGAQQHHISRRFAVRGEDKFDGVPFLDGDAGLPLLEGAIARFHCRKERTIDAGDHLIFLGEIEEHEELGGEPLVFHSGRYRIATKHPDV